MNSALQRSGSGRAASTTASDPDRSAISGTICCLRRAVVPRKGYDVLLAGSRTARPLAVDGPVGAIEPQPRNGSSPR